MRSPSVSQDTSGNAATATTLATARSIGGVSFNGSADIIPNIVTDTTPQLGGSLDVNGNTVTSTNNGNIEIDPDGSGLFKIKGNSTAGSGSLTLNCELNSHGIKLQGPPHSAGASYTLTFPDNDGNADQVIKSDGSGRDYLNIKAGGIGPFVGGYGFGARSTLLGYFMKLDCAWEMKGIFRGKPLLYFGIGLDF